MSALIPKHGGYRNLKTFQIARLIFDITCRFCDKFIDKRSRTHDQMVQAARSGVQNIAEGSQGSGTSKKNELKLTNVARASLEELLLDYEDFLRQRSFNIWDYKDPRRQSLVNLRPNSANQFVIWAHNLEKQGSAPLAEIAANGTLVLLSVVRRLMDRQIQSLGNSFQTEGGFTEKLYHARKNARNG